MYFNIGFLGKEMLKLCELQIDFWDIPLFSANRKASEQESRGMQYWFEVRCMWTLLEPADLVAIAVTETRDQEDLMCY